MKNSILILLIISALCSLTCRANTSSRPGHAWNKKMNSCKKIKCDTAIVTQLFYNREKNVVRCTFNTASEGDCPHIRFSCGDFGLAEIKLGDKELALWNSLYVESSSGYQPNDDYVGKIFEITYQKTSVKACDGSEDLHQVDAPLVIGFKLISNP